MRLPFGVELAQPWFLLGLLFVVPAIWWSRRSAGRVVFSSLRALPGGGHTWRTRIAWVPDALMGLAIMALVLALTGPRAGDKSSRVRREGIAIALAVDVSGSMKAQDLAGSSGASCDRAGDDQTRLGVVKRAFEQIVLGGKGLRGRPDDAIGLVAFANSAETRSPPAVGHGNPAHAARQLDFAPDDESGTRIGNGLSLAVERLREFKKDEKVARVAILLTDGETTIRDENTIDEDTAIDQAIEAGVKVYTIGAGKKGNAPICVDDMDGRGRLRQMQVSIDEATLGKIAEKTGGAYFRAENGSALRQIYSQIDKLTRTSIEEERFTEYHQYYTYFVTAALLLLAVGLLLRGTMLRRLP